MKRHKVKVEKRTILGKKIKKLRKEGILPANIYGKGIKSIVVQLPYKDFEKVYKDVGETGLLDVALNGQTKPCLIHNVQVNHYKNLILHADFYQVDLKEKVTTMMPLKIIGTPKAVADKIGLLEQPLSQVEVEALPTDLPENIEVNVDHLAAVDEQISVADLKAPQNVTILTGKDRVVVKIGELISKEAQEQAAAEAAAAEATKAAAATPPAEGAKPEAAEAGKAETTKQSEDKPPKSPKSTSESAKPQK